MKNLPLGGQNLKMKMIILKHLSCYITFAEMRRNIERSVVSKTASQAKVCYQALQVTNCRK